MSELRLVTHNVGSRTGPDTPNSDPDELRDNLARLADHTQAHAVAVQEATRLRRPIPGYSRIAVEWPRHPDDLGCQLLIRDDVRLFRRRILAVDGPWWTGPKHGLRHPPKVFVGAALGVDRHRWDVLSVHRVWTGDGRRNTEAWEHEHDKLTEWLEARARRDEGHRPVVALGDWNGRTTDRWPNSIGQLARAVGGELAMRGIDGALAINVRRVRARELDRLYGSDAHQPVAVTVTA